ncbi:hypothetical protein PG990_010845 [Apiospora arundinis]
MQQQQSIPIPILAEKVTYPAILNIDLLEYPLLLLLVTPMCKELHQRWYGCDCWGFLRCYPCGRLFKGCLGLGGEDD